MHSKKFLILMRHAQAESSPLITDFNRPLTNFGKQQAEDMGQKLKQVATIKKILVSSSLRTKETRLFLGNFFSCPTFFEPGLYNALVEDARGIIEEHALDCEYLMVIAHNPAVALLTEYFCGHYQNFHTATAAILSTKLDKLADAIRSPGQFSLEHLLLAKRSP